MLICIFVKSNKDNKDFNQILIVSELANQKLVRGPGRGSEPEREAGLEMVAAHTVEGKAEG